MSGITTKVQLDESGQLFASEERIVREMSEDAQKMRESDVTEKMLLEDIKIRDIDNLSLVLNASKVHEFPSMRHAMYFMGQSLNRALTKFGCGALNHHAKRPDPQNSDTDFLERVLQKQMLKKQVKCEHRKPDLYPPQDRWRSGLYIYKGNEIAYFISNPMMMNETRRNGIIIPGQKTWLVKTNVPVG